MQRDVVFQTELFKGILRSLIQEYQRTAGFPQILRFDASAEMPWELKSKRIKGWWKLLNQIYLS